MKVPWLPKSVIAEAAARTLELYEQVIQGHVTPPIPIEDVIERGLNLGLGFYDLNKQLGMDDVLGATYVTKQLICVNESLLNESQLGRMFFTMAHEAGHWVLHRQLLNENNSREDVSNFKFCRKRDAKMPIEWQADYFASCLMMPGDAMRAAFYRTFGRDELVLHSIESCFRGPINFDPCAQNWPLIAQSVMESGGFTNVSKQAVIIRLQHLGLLINRSGGSIGWHAVT